jgi:hypothetical protein
MMSVCRISSRASSAWTAASAVPTRGRISPRRRSPQRYADIRKPLDLPMEVAKHFVKDMQAYFAAENRVES